MAISISKSQNGDGFISRDELESVMGGVKMSKEEWDQLMDECDTNKDGKISRVEFVGMMLNPDIAVKIVRDYEEKKPSVAQLENDLVLKQTYQSEQIKSSK